MGDSAELLARVTGVPVSSRAQVLLQELASAASGARQGASTSI